LALAIVVYVVDLAAATTTGEIMSSEVGAPTPVSETLDAVSKSWWIVLILGLTTSAIGVSALNHPVRAYHTIAVLFGLWLIVTGIVSIVRGLASHIDGGLRVMLVLSGTVSLFLGSSFLHATIVEKIALLSLYIGIVFLFRGAIDLIAGFSSQVETGRAWTIFMGIIGMIAGLYMINNPFAGAAAWISTMAWLLIFFGILEIFGAFRIRSLAK